MIANLVQFHHVPWEDGAGLSSKEKTCLWKPHIAFADRIAVLIETKDEILKRFQVLLRKSISLTAESLCLS